MVEFKGAGSGSLGIWEMRSETLCLSLELWCRKQMTSLTSGSHVAEKMHCCLQHYLEFLKD